jgi:hypothetical protein
MTKKRQQYEPTMLETIISGLFKGIWWILTLPFKGLSRGKRGGISVKDRNHLAAKRNEIASILQGSQSSIELRHAVSEADKLVDYALQLKGYSGNTMADRLKNARDYIDRDMYNEIWEGHIVRNKIAHEHEFELHNSEYKEAANKLLKYLKTL